MPAEPATTDVPRKRITTPDGTVAELIETVPAAAPARGSVRTKARKRALDILFEADLRRSDPRESLTLHTAEADPPVRPLTADLVLGVTERQAEIDALIADCLASDWSLERMPRVERCLARIAIWEMQSGTSSAEVAVQQAVQLAQELSTDGSANFLNGLLAKVKQRLEGNQN